MSELIPFDYEGTNFRALRDSAGDPWFVAKDACTILGTETRDLRKILDEDEVSNVDSIHIGGISAGNGGRSPLAISEAGLYSLILRSRKPEAKAFKRWVTHEVLPSIRKQGGYINPRATEHQVNALIRQAQMQMELCQAAKGLIDADHLQAKARIILARGMGEAPQIDPQSMPLYTQDFLRDKNLSRNKLRSVMGNFGKAVKAAYIAENGVEPDEYPMNLTNGQVRHVKAYTEADRPLMERVWAEKFAAKVGGAR